MGPRVKGPPGITPLGEWHFANLWLESRPAMTFRTRLLLVFTVAIIASVGMVEWLIAGITRGSFERTEAQRVDALVAQFQKEFTRRKQEIVRAVNAIADSDAVANVTSATDYSPFVNEAPPLAASYGLDLLELVAGDGSIISSAEWPARFGYYGELAHRRRELEGARSVSEARRGAPRRGALPGVGRYLQRRRSESVRGGRPDSG